MVSYLISLCKVFKFLSIWIWIRVNHKSQVILIDFHALNVEPPQETDKDYRWLLTATEDHFCLQR